VLAFVIGNLPIPAAGIAANGVNAGIQLLASGAGMAYNRYQFKKALKEIQSLIAEGYSPDDLVSACVQSGQWTKEFGDKITTELAQYTSHVAGGEGQALSELIEDDIKDIENHIKNEDDEKDKNTPMTAAELNKLNEVVETSRKKRLVKCKVCGAAGVNARSHFNEKSASYSKHDHSKDAADPKTPAKGAASPDVKLVAMTTPTPTKGAVPRCQALYAGGQNAGTQCTAPAVSNDRCGQHAK
jgi:hypothetical protein